MHVTLLADSPPGSLSLVYTCQNQAGLSSITLGNPHIQVPSLIHPPPATTGKEALNIESSTFNSNNLNVSLFIRNTGSATVSFTTYYVKDAAGNTYTQVAYTFGPTIQPNAVGTANIGINTQCGGSCTNSRSTYTFVSGNSYTVTFVTSRNGQFVFTVVR